VSSADAATAFIPQPALGTMAAGYVFAGRFRIERMLGAGGMGAVYKAWDESLGIPVALKIIRPEFAADQAMARASEERFKQELLLARRVTHRNVIRIHDLGESGGIKFITMHFVDGKDLASILREGRLPFERALSFAKQIVAGLQAAHEVGIVHRDLKPQNVLVDDTDTVYITDFGLAKSLEMTMVGLTRAGDLIGTPRYISPEQITGKPADHRSDLYAVGLILYEMVTGGSPFSGETAMDLMFQRVQKAAPDPRALAPELPEYFRRVVLRCLERDPADRYGSAAEVLSDLEAARAAPIASATRTISLTLPLPASKKWPLVVGGVILLALIASAPAIRRALVTSGDAPASAPKQTIRLAVLPFNVIGEGNDLAPVAVGVTEAITAKLFGAPGVTVASAAAVQQAGTDRPIADVAHDVGAGIVVAGTVQGTAAAMRITVTVDDAAAGKRVWARDYSGVAGDLLTLEDQIYNDLSSALNLTLSNDQLARAVVHPTENVDAYQLYLRGRNAMRGQQDVRNVQAAIGFYEDALKRDPMFALAYAGIADSAVRMYRITKDAEWSQKALAAAQQAQRLDEKLVEVQLALASVYQATGKNSEAIAILTTAAQSAPNSDDIQRRLGRVLLGAGRGREAIAAYERSVAINPYYWQGYGALSNAYMQLGDYAKAEAALRKVIDLEPQNATGYNDLGAAYLQMGRYDDAVTALKKALDLHPIAQTYTNLGIAYASAKRYAEAVPMFEKSVELSPNSEQFVGNLADGYRWAGQQEKAAATYDKATALALKALQVNPRDAVVRANLAMYYAKRGDQSRARRLIADARAIDKANVNLAYAQATVEALGGRATEALDALSEAVGAGYPLAAARSDPDLQSLVSDPRFARLGAPAAAPK
jgi:serine/threonine-protein kinase